MIRRITIIRKRFSRASLITVIFIVRAAGRLLPFPLAVVFGGLFGRSLYYLLRRDRERALSNLETVFPGRDSAWNVRTAKRMFAHLGKSLLELVALTPRRISKLVECDGLETLRSALAQGRGLVFVTGHIGNWEIMAGAVAMQCPLSVIAAPIEPDALNETIVRLRAKLGVRTIVRSRPGATKELIRVFREKRVLGLLIDQDTDVEGVFVDFMGRPAWTPSAATQVAVKFNAPVIFGYIKRLSNNKHRITIEGPVPLAVTSNPDEDTRVNTADLTKRIESAILKSPEQWVWMHRRWRRRP